LLLILYAQINTYFLINDSYKQGIQMNISKALGLVVTGICLMQAPQCFAAKGDYDMSWGGSLSPGAQQLQLAELCDQPTSSETVIGEIHSVEDGVIGLADIIVDPEETGYARIGVLFKTDQNGDLDTSFGTKGVICSFVGRKILIGSDKSIFTAGTFYDSTTRLAGFSINKVTSDGHADTSFGQNGKALSYWPMEQLSMSQGFGYVGELIELDQGGIAIYGTITYPEMYRQPVSAVFNSTGTEEELTRLSPYVEEDGRNWSYGFTIGFSDGEWFQTMENFLWDNEPLNDKYISYIRSYKDATSTNPSFGNEGTIKLNQENESLKIEHITRMSDDTNLLTGLSYSPSEPQNRTIRLLQVGRTGAINPSLRSDADIELPPLIEVSENQYSSVDLSYASSSLRDTSEILTYINQVQFISDESNNNETYTGHYFRRLFALTDDGTINTELFSNGVLDLGENFNIKQITEQPDGKVLLSGNCKTGDNWNACIKRIHWNNPEPHDEVRGSTSSGSMPVTLFYFLIVALFIRFKTKKSILG
jgi:hypothetical protein